MKLVVGLGNPGQEYENTPHNVGFWAVEALAKRLSAGTPQSRFQGEFYRLGSGEDAVMLLKPQTYMNLSGASVGECARFYKLAPEDILVLSDDLDLPPGKARAREKGGHGGHNGLRSIMEHLGTDAFRRIRIGIGRPAHKDQVTAYVLKPWQGEAAVLGKAVIERVLDLIERFLKNSRWNSTSLSVERSALFPEDPVEPRSSTSSS
jgi:PTH1 family peptidyl-tRNA hydrolase